jgi:hypothetical protein
VPVHRILILDPPSYSGHINSLMRYIICDLRLQISVISKDLMGYNTDIIIFAILIVLVPETFTFALLVRFP